MANTNPPRRTDRSKAHHPTLIAANLIICEKVLAEQSGVMSAIRIVDVFAFTANPKSPRDKQGVKLTVLSSVRLKPEDASEHSFELKVVFPDGSSAIAAKAIETSPPVESRRFPQFPTGLNVLGEIGISTTQTGTHYLCFLFDGIQVARTPFSLVEAKDEGTPQK